MRLEILGYTAQRPRKTKPIPNELREMFPRANNSTEVISYSADVKQTLSALPNVVGSTLGQTKKIAPYFVSISGSNLENICRNIWQFYYDYVPYSNDAPGREQLRTPSRLIEDATKGIGSDCDCYTLSISSILNNMGIKNYAKVIKRNGTANWHHIYIIVPKNPNAFSPKRDKNNPSTYYVIDPVVDSPLTEPDKITDSVLVDMNIGKNSLGSVFGEYPQLSYMHELEGVFSHKNLSGLGAACGCNSPEQLNQALVTDILERVKIHIINTINRLRYKHFDGKEWAIKTLTDIAENIHDPIAREKIIADLRKQSENHNQELGNIFKDGWDWTKGVVTRFVDAVAAMAEKIKDIASKPIAWVKQVATDAWDWVLKMSPLSDLVRKTILRAFRNNSGRMSEKLRWAFADEAQLTAAGLPLNTRDEAQNRFSKVLKAWTAWGGTQEELVTAILTSAPLPPYIDSKNAATALRGTLSATLEERDYTFYQLMENDTQYGDLSKKSIKRGLFAMLLGTFGVGMTLEKVSAYMSNTNNVRAILTDKDNPFYYDDPAKSGWLSAPSGMAGLGAYSKFRSFFVGLARKDNKVLIFYVNIKDSVANSSIQYYKTMDYSEVGGSKLGKPLTAISACVIPFFANQTDYDNIAKIQAENTRKWLLNVKSMNLFADDYRDIPLYDFTSDHKAASGYLENVILKDLSDKQFFVLPRNDGWYVIYHLNYKTTDTSAYPTGYYTDNAGTPSSIMPPDKNGNLPYILKYQFNTLAYINSGIYGDYTTANAALFNGNTPRAEFYSKLTEAEFKNLFGSKIKQTKNGAYQYILSTTPNEMQVFLNNRYTKKVSPNPAYDSKNQSGASASSGANSGSGTATSQSSYTSSGSNSSGYTVVKYDNINDLIKPQTGTAVAFGSVENDMYIPSSVRRMAYRSANNGLGFIDPMTAGVIINTVKPIVSNMIASCREKNPNNAALQAAPDPDNKENIKIAGISLERIDKFLTANPNVAKKLSEPNPTTGNQDINMNDVNVTMTDSEIQGYADKYNTEDDINKKAGDIEDKHGINIGDIMSYIPLAADNTFSPYDSMLEEDKANAGKEGQTWLAKIFLWLRDFWHTIFPAHTWIGKWVTLFYNTLAKVSDKVWAAAKKIIGCGNQPAQESTTPDSGNGNGGLVVAGAALAAGLFLLKPASKEVSPHPKSGLKGIENKSFNNLKKINYEI